KSRVRANLKHGSVRGINNQQRRLKRCLLDKISKFAMFINCYFRHDTLLSPPKTNSRNFPQEGRG
ncbi:MAG: hypothetical protein COY50_08990, partial [Deltaproteobacteria bacterium CG_4_10_14_0_8_um_filter_43_12]